MDISTALKLLVQESAELDAIVAELNTAQWHRDTPSIGWTVAHQIGHLHWTDSVALLSINDPAAFTQMARSLPSGAVNQFADTYAAWDHSDLLTAWRRDRTALITAVESADPGEKAPWFGPPMRPITMVTARIMETWAHGLDIYDALSVQKPPTAVLAAVARIGYRTRAFSYASHGLEAPDTDIYIQLDMPDGSILEFGTPSADQRITGTADGFCRVVTQRRNRDDVALTVDGGDAAAWMDIAQAFAGRPTTGPRPRERTTSHEI